MTARPSITLIALTSGPLLPYVEPYYRPMLGDGVVVHEVGVLVKVALLTESSYEQRAARR